MFYLKKILLNTIFIIRICLLKFFVATYNFAPSGGILSGLSFILVSKTANSFIEWHYTANIAQAPSFLGLYATKRALELAGDIDDYYDAVLVAKPYFRVQVYAYRKLMHEILDLQALENLLSFINDNKLFKINKEKDISKITTRKIFEICDSADALSNILPFVSNDENVFDAVYAEMIRINEDLDEVIHVFEFCNNKQIKQLAVDRILELSNTLKEKTKRA